MLKGVLLHVEVGSGHSLMTAYGYFRRTNCLYNAEKIDPDTYQLAFPKTKVQKITRPFQLFQPSTVV